MMVMTTRSSTSVKAERSKAESGERKREAGEQKAGTGRLALSTAWRCLVAGSKGRKGEYAVENRAAKSEMNEPRMTKLSGW